MARPASSADGAAMARPASSADGAAMARPVWSADAATTAAWVVNGTGFAPAPTLFHVRGSLPIKCNTLKTNIFSKDLAIFQNYVSLLWAILISWVRKFWVPIPWQFRRSFWAGADAPRRVHACPAWRSAPRAVPRNSSQIPPASSYHRLRSEINNYWFLLEIRSSLLYVTGFRIRICIP
jgi:hypothetical protein